MFWEKEEKSSGGIAKGLAIAGGAALLAGWITNRVMKSKKDIEETDEKEEYHEIRLSNNAEKQYFLVYQNNDFEKEYENGYIWAPEETESGRAIFHWDNLKKVKKDDIIFSLVDRKIVSVNVAKKAYTSKAIDGVDGNMVDLEYEILDNEIDVDDYMDEILELSPEKYAPFNVMGRSNSGYLFDIGEKMGKYLIEIIEENKK